MAAVDPGLMDRVLDRMGLPDSVDITPESLAQVYDAWCNSVPFDNVQKRVYFGEDRSGRLPPDSTEGLALG